MSRNFTAPYYGKALMALAAMFSISASMAPQAFAAEAKADEGAVAEVTDQNFSKEVLKSNKPVLVDFWAPWCGPCRAQGPIVEEVSVALAGKLKVVKLNTEANPKMSLKYEISSIPALYIFKKGKVVDKLIGLRPKEMLLSEVSKYLK